MRRSIFIVYFLAFAPGSMFGQGLEFDQVRKLPSAVSSPGEESLPLLAPDGATLFFTRSLYAGNIGGKFSGMDIWYAKAGPEGWTNPTHELLPPGINNKGHNALVGISPDGKERYFLNAAVNHRIEGIYVSSRINDYWTRPQFVPIPGIDNQTFLGAFVSPDFDVIILSMKGADSRGEEDLYFSVKNSTGQWSVPKNMGTTLNTSGFEISPFLSSDKTRLYFASNGHKGEGDADIFYSERLYNSWETWSVPVNLGAGVNSKKFDAYFSIYGDSIAYFASNRDGNFSDLFQVKVVPARTVLTEGQRYLSADEWARVFGGSVSDEILFSRQATGLDPSQRELLFFIANKLQLQKDILIHLVVVEQEDERASQERLKSIKDHLVQSGIGKERIIIDQVEPPKASGRGKVVIRLIE